jgi:hypothetical protein
MDSLTDVGQATRRAKVISPAFYTGNRLLGFQRELDAGSLSFEETYMRTNIFWLRWRHAFTIGVIALILGVVRFVIDDTLEIDAFTPNPLLPGMISGALILLGFLLASVLVDFKEAEKMPTEIAGAVQNIYDEGVYTKELKPDFDLERLRLNLHNVVSNFLQEIANGKGADKTLAAISQLNEPFLQMEKLNMPAAYISRLKNEQATLRRTVLRAGYIKETPAVMPAYLVAEIASIIVIGFMFTFEMSSPHEAAALVFSISFLLIYTQVLIRDLDDPFESQEGHGHGFTAEVNLTTLYSLKHSLELQSPNPSSRHV